MANWAVKYRPKELSDVKGQEHVTEVIRRLLEINQLPSGMLFAGSRGTGKTTTARILAKVLNCSNRAGSVVCGDCRFCKGDERVFNEAVVEIDAASHGLVDDVRQLREMANYSYRGEVRVFLVDEAHSLSSAACNALLKILEEPPEGVLFIFCTTEPNKILETVRSRLMCFEFRSLPILELEGRLRFIADSEGLQAEDGVFVSIARYSLGGMRDAIVCMEQLSYYTKNCLTQEAFESYFGIVGRKIVESFIQAILSKNYMSGLQITQRYFSRVSEGKQFIEELIRYFRDILLVKQGFNIDISNSIVKRFSDNLVFRILDLLWDIQVNYLALDSFLADILFIKFVSIVFGITEASSVVEIKQEQQVKERETKSVLSMLSDLG